MNTKTNQVYTSALGKLYAEKQGLRDLNAVAESVYQSFVFFIKCGETLPIIASPVELRGLVFTQQELEKILFNLCGKGCVVNYDSNGGNNTFTLINLLWGVKWTLYLMITYTF